jgi:hypothetical protein
LAEAAILSGRPFTRAPGARGRSLAAGALAAALLAACAGSGPKGPATGSARPASPPATASATPAPAANPAAPSAPADVPATATPAAPPGPLAAESQWMHSLFQGTPVLLADEPDGTLRVEVPLAYAFDTEASAAKPPLRAVLDRLAQSLGRQKNALLHLGPPGPKAKERLADMRNYLIGKGVARARLPATGSSGSAASPNVQLRLTLAPAPVVKLEDTAPTAAAVPVPARAASAPTKAASAAAPAKVASGLASAKAASAPARSASAAAARPASAPAAVKPPAGR